ncbi:MAG TPA: acetyl-CoA carboxylase biotin carboxyl carrier protein subunit [Anaerolineae bacterium]|nr:acetyl-CoA carboxylase biotin carboxyl carrier protein subunit [Anaerolineae bacterium]HQH38999.1 acetyl-CoA carboxylase biotin carboxyl carrier protein subunit [Anaerolineae bacterium]
MSIYCVSIGEQEYNVQITDTRVLVNGEPVKADLVSLNGNGLHVFRQGNCVREFYLHLQAQGTVEVLAEGRRVLAHVDMAGRHTRHRASTPAGDVVAPMPGLVVNVLVKAGEHVEKDQVLVILESMKMQMQLKAPFAGKVERVAAIVGAQVEKGKILVQVSE